jgi:hypothetical protein
MKIYILLRKTKKNISCELVTTDICKIGDKLREFEIEDLPIFEIWENNKRLKHVSGGKSQNGGIIEWEI